MVEMGGNGVEMGKVPIFLHDDRAKQRCEMKLHDSTIHCVLQQKLNP
jgi:hypothetical protein